MPQNIEIDEHQPFWIANWQVDPAACRINKGEQEVKLEPKAMAVLVCLAQNPGKVMPRELLEATVWKGTVVGYDSLANSIIKLRRALGDDSKNPNFIETVPKSGYRLIAEVSTSAPDGEKVSAANNTPHDRGLLVKLPFTTAVVLLVMGMIGLAGYFLASDSPSTHEKSAIAVLPFKNLSNDPNQEYFSDGMTADLITDLSKISSLVVIARNSVFAYKNMDVDVRKLHDELGVDYVVEGSVRRAGDTVRISVRLIDARQGHNLWADRFDGALKNIFSLQDEVAQKLVSSLEVRLTENERLELAREYTRSIEAYDEFLHGWQQFWTLSKESNHLARKHYLRAIELDDQFARAYANLAMTYAYDFINAWHDDANYSIQQAKLYAKKAVELDATLPQVHWVAALTHNFDKEYKAALASAQQTLVHDPNYADGYGIMSTILNYAGQPKQALAAMEKATQLNPHYPHIYLIIRGEIYFNLRDYKNAIKDFKQALDRNPEAQEARLWLAASFAHQGEMDEARWQLEHVRVANKNMTLDYVEKVTPFNDPGQRKHLLDGLRKAGL